MLVLRALVILLLISSLLLITGLFGSFDDDLSSKIDRLGVPYDSSIFTLYDHKIYANVPSNGKYQVTQADVSTFKTFSDKKDYQSQKVATDKNHVYAGNLIVPNLDPSKTVSLGDDYYSDGQHTYYLGSNSIRNDTLNVVVEIFQLMLYGLNLGEKPQTYLYPIQELPISSQPYYSLLENSVATDGEAVFFEGKRLPQADPTTLRQLAQLYDNGDERPSYDYFADNQHVYYKSKLLPFSSNADIYSFEIEGNSIESYLFDPRTGKVFMHDVAFDEKHTPYELITPYGAHVYHALFGSKDGIYYYDREDNAVKRAGDNPLYDSKFEALSEFVFTDGKNTLFLESSEHWSSKKSNGTRSQNTFIKQMEGIDASLWKNIGTCISGFGSIWENAGKLYYFDNMGSGQSIKNSVYSIDTQQTAQTLLQDNLRSGQIKDLVDRKHLIPLKGKTIVTALSKYGSNFNTLWLLLIAVAIIPIATLLQKKFKVLQAPFMIKDDKLQMLTLFPKSFKLSEIRQVIFTQHYHFRAGYSGKMQVLLKNGHYSRHYLFSKTLARDGELETRDFIIKQQEILKSHGVDSIF